MTSSLEPAGRSGGSLARVQSVVASAVRWVGLLPLIAGGALLVFLVVALALQVLFRYVIQQPLAWSEESARYALVWLSMLAAVVAAREGQHFLFRWVTLRFPPSLRFWVRRACDLFVMIMLAVIFWQSMIYLGVVANRTSPGTGLNMRWPYAGVTVGSALLFILYLLENVDAMLSLRTGVVLSARELNEAEVQTMFERSDAGRAD
jgi:TRAP-type C4-dicarboxylate transport system permease small subunit